MGQAYPLYLPATENRPAALEIPWAVGLFTKHLYVFTCFFPYPAQTFLILRLFVRCTASLCQLVSAGCRFKAAQVTGKLFLDLADRHTVYKL